MEINVDALIQRIRAELDHRAEQTASASSSQSHALKAEAHKKPVKTFERLAETPLASKLTLAPMDDGEPGANPAPNLTYSLTDLLAFEDKEFVCNAYKAILKRTPDEGGLEHYLARLNRNASKLDILCVLCNSIEGKSIGNAIDGLPALDELRRRYRFRFMGRLMYSNAKSQCHVDDLLPYQNQHFIHAAYKAILRRPADAGGVAHHLSLLQQGFSKREILRRLRYSSEGKLAAVRVNGLALPTILQRCFNIPILGRLLRLVAALWNLPNLERNQRSLESRLLVVTEQGKANTQAVQRIVIRAVCELDVAYKRLLASTAPASDPLALKECIDALRIIAESKADYE